MSNSTGLTDTQQAIAVFLTAVIAALVGWSAAGFPTSRLAIGAVVALILAGVGLALKELGGTATTTAFAFTPSPASASSTPATKAPTAFLKLKKRLMFLQLHQ
jgi:hypothetical protein